MSFIRFIPAQYLLQNQTEPLDLPENDCQDEEYAMPAKRGDKLMFIVDKSAFNNNGSDVADLKVGLTNNGVPVSGGTNIGTVEESKYQYFVTVTIPENIMFSCYNLVIYNGIDPLDCGLYNNATLGSLAGLTLGQFANCRLGDFAP